MVAAAKIILLDQTIFQWDLALSKAYLNLQDAKILSAIHKVSVSFMHALVPKMAWQILLVFRTLNVILVPRVLELDVENQMALVNLLVSKSLDVILVPRVLELDVKNQMALVNPLVSKSLDVIIDHLGIVKAVEQQMAIVNPLVSKNPNAVECLKVSIVDR